MRAIQSAWQTFDEWQSRMTGAVQDTWQGLAVHMASLPTDREWISFSARSDHLLDPETPLRNPANIHWPSKDDPSVIPVHTGTMERKKRYTRTYKEHYFVLTPAGFLHEYVSSDPLSPNGQSPIFSLFLPACTLGPPSAPSAKSHKFHIEGRTDGMGTTKTGSIRSALGLAGRNNHAWSFRCRSREDMMEWWNDVRMLCARYLIASEQMERSGPVAAAVRSVGYTTDDEEDEEDEGSSVEEEEGEPIEYHDEEENSPPSYSHPRDSGIELGGNGYAVSLASSSSFLVIILMILSCRLRRKEKSALVMEATTVTTVPMSVVELVKDRWRRHRKDVHRMSSTLKAISLPLEEHNR